ncbi:hypothetical protein [Corynebacterium xerosis]|uniref:hypothetical protein n=1 Tax=Corynebacterium xerosis TaxID=1725 RepID=UPI0011AF977F|nr:hypothetical protein [Corynebacterium xerosis]
MGKAVDVRQSDVHHLITQAYHAGGRYQWAREGAVNAIEAGATWIKFGIERQGFENKGVARRYIADNGHGMNADDLRTFLSTFGGGGRKIGFGHNFGQGFKASCYEWNPFGIIVASWTKEDPVGKMIWIYRKDDGDSTTWQLKDFAGGGDTENDLDDCVNPHNIPAIGVDVSKLKFPEIEEAGQGTVFLFLGDTVDRNTEMGDYKRKEDQQRGIVSYLNQRFIELPHGVEVSVESLGARQDTSTKDVPLKSPAGKKQFLSNRKVRGIRAGISSDIAASGTLQSARNTKIHWFLTKTDDVTKDPTYRTPKPVIVVKYENEAYDVKKLVSDYRLFGIVDDVRDRVWLIIEPPQMNSDGLSWGVIPQASRGALIANDGEGLPWAAWQDDFYERMPREIRDAINEARSGDSTEDEGERAERLQRIMTNFGKRFMVDALVEDDAGNRRGTEGAPGSSPGPDDPSREKGRSADAGFPRGRNENTGISGDVVILNPDDAGRAFGKNRKKANGLPAVVWENGFKESDRFHAARFNYRDVRNGSFGTVFMNASWPLFDSQLRYWSERYPRVEESSILPIMRAAYEDEVVSKVMHAYKMRNARLGKDENGHQIKVQSQLIDEWTSPAALTAGVLGLVNVETRIAKAIGSKYGRSTR